ncbi:D-2-hydroxyacid dehydrogenase [Pseudomonas sp. RIT-PI-AD]|uniref:D-2-hydroxyacid dehydrogenase n=1 Tax=Pseudomonas sp. RIT-PI-AD TaxID=3035294 RepID=UPI0021D9CEC1|nr:D-2-hydroxyacid dehydrogenase [Pseudomonas sp. RIT-PI-AD]
MNVLIAERYHADYSRLLRDALPGLRLCSGEDPEELSAMAPDFPIWFGQPDLLASLLRSGARPRWAQSTWAGIAPLLAADLPRDYRVSRSVGVFGQVMAEYALTYVLAHERQLLSRLASQVERRWDNRQPPSLGGRRMLIVGVGEIGQSVATYLAPFGIHLTGIARRPRPLPGFAEVGGIADLPRLAVEADYLLNLLPDTPQTRDLYDAALFARMCPTALFINAGRGTSVVDADLIAALEAGQLAGAVLDVCRVEPLPAGDPLWTAPRLLLTGHSAAPTLREPVAQLFLENLARFQGGEPLRGELDFQRGY